MVGNLSPNVDKSAWSTMTESVLSLVELELDNYGEAYAGFDHTPVYFPSREHIASNMLPTMRQHSKHALWFRNRIK